MEEEILTLVPWERAQEDFCSGIMNAINTNNQELFEILIDMPKNLHFEKKFDLTKYGNPILEAAMQKDNLLSSLI